jgi:crossover junction endodeoxyribonuclease RuvC
MRVLGVDPGLKATGYGVIDYEAGRCRLVEGGVIETAAAAELAERLARIYAGVESVARQFQPEVAVVESLYAKYRSPRTALLMSHARGVVLLALAHCGVEVVSYPASLVKRALAGHGRAAKRQVAGMVAQVLGVSMDAVPDHVSDALAIAICHSTPWAAGWGQRPAWREPQVRFLQRGRRV